MAIGNGSGGFHESSSISLGGGEAGGEEDGLLEERELEEIDKEVIQSE